MARDYAPVARDLIAALGGETNIQNVTHCMTRLRFVVADEARVNPDGIESIDGVLGLTVASGQYQVIIGNNVAKAYREVLRLVDMGEASGIARGTRKEKLTPKVVLARILDAIVGTMTPIIPAIIGCAMLKLVILALQMLGVLQEGTTTYTILTVFGDASFYFLPLLVAASAANKFGVNLYLAVTIAGVLVHPSLVGLLQSGESVSLAGLPVVSSFYPYSVIPPLMMTWLLAHIERLVDRITPDITKNFLKPMLVVLIAAPVAVLAVGPLGAMLGNALSAGVLWIQETMGWVAVAVMGVVWPLLVMCGMHHTFTPIVISTLSLTGMEFLVMPAQLGANLAQGGASLAVALRTKNKKLRQTASAASASALVAGITEPAMYGVTLRLRRPLIAVLLTGGVCGAICGLTGIAAFANASPALVTSMQFVDPQRPITILWVLVIMAVAVALSFSLTLLLGFEDIPEREQAPAPAAEPEQTGIALASPVSGAAVPLSEVGDEAFASGVLGEGIAVIPDEGRVYAVDDAVVDTVSETGHAIGLLTKDGLEVLIHIGRDTVALKGEGFFPQVREGDAVRPGDLLIEFDLEGIRAKGFDPTVMILITNSSDYQKIEPCQTGGSIPVGQRLLAVQ